MADVVIEEEPELCECGHRMDSHHFITEWGGAQYQCVGDDGSGDCDCENFRLKPKEKT